MIKRFSFGVLILMLLHVNLGQEKFTLLDTTKENGNVREVRIGRATTQSYNAILATTSKPLSTTKVPYKTLECPPEPIRIPIFSLPCNHEKDCKVFGPSLVCCKEHCIKGVLVPVQSKTTHQPKRAAAKITNTITNELPQNEPVKSTTLKPTTVQNSKNNANNLNKQVELVCPNRNSRIPFFSLPCIQNSDCGVFGRNLLCCRKVCLQGIPPPKEEVNHSPALFGLVDRHCPAQPLAELLDVKECETDADCLPRICCPEKSGVNKSYCRTPVHNIERLPGAKRIQEPLRNFVSYMQCTPPPPRELFPKSCNNTLDCFPNLCCQENGKKFCRPPRRSLVALVADVTTRVGAAEATRRFIERITS